jgi:hypothetical protein
MFAGRRYPNFVMYLNHILLLDKEPRQQYVGEIRLNMFADLGDKHFQICRVIHTKTNRCLRFLYVSFLATSVSFRTSDGRRVQAENIWLMGWVWL